MSPTQKRRCIGIVVILLGLSCALFLVLYALSQNISLFYSPTQIHLKEAPTNVRIRVGGMVEKGSLNRLKDNENGNENGNGNENKNENGLSVHFVVTDFNKSLSIHYTGILPDLFREGQGIVAGGRLQPDGTFKADEVLAKHDENYMPPEVSKTLNKSEKTKIDSAVVSELKPKIDPGVKQ